MIPVTQLRAGSVFEENNEPLLVLKYEHTKMGRGTATIRVKVKNLKMGSVTEKTFISGAKVQESTILKKRLQYLYHDNDYIFMDPKTYEQISLEDEVAGESKKYLTEGILVDVLFWQETALGIELPPKMEFVVSETEPGVKGNSAVNIYKPAKLTNGMTIRVPLFINIGDRILADTRTGEYLERAK